MAPDLHKNPGWQASSHHCLAGLPRDDRRKLRMGRTDQARIRLMTRHPWRCESERRPSGLSEGLRDTSRPAANVTVQIPHRAVNLVAALPACPLLPFGRAEGVGIDVAAGDGVAKVAHRPLHGLDKRGRGVLEHVPAVADLQGPRSTLGGPLVKAAAAVAAQDLDAELGRKPVCDSAAFPVRQQINGALAFEVADNGSVTLALEPREVSDADDAHVGRRR